MKTVTAKVDGVAMEVEAGSEPADMMIALKQGHSVPSSGKEVSSGEPGGASSQYGDFW
jgi:hypothetical protein